MDEAIAGLKDKLYEMFSTLFCTKTVHYGQGNSTRLKSKNCICGYAHDFCKNKLRAMEGQSHTVKEYKLYE